MQLAGIMSPDSPTKSAADGVLRVSFQLAFRFLFQEKTRATEHRGDTQTTRQQRHAGPQPLHSFFLSSFLSAAVSSVQAIQGTSDIKYG